MMKKLTFPLRNDDENKIEAAKQKSHPISNSDVFGKITQLFGTGFTHMQMRSLQDSFQKYIFTHGTQMLSMYMLAHIFAAVLGQETEQEGSPLISFLIVKRFRLVSISLVSIP